MPRRLAAIVALLAVLVTPLGALWCAYACAADDGDAASPLVRDATGAVSLVNAFAQEAAVRTHDECAADLTNRAFRAVLKERAHEGRRLVSRWSVPASVSVTQDPVGLPLRRSGALESPPGARASTVRRV